MMLLQKHFNVFVRPSPLALAQEELENAQRSLLSDQTAAEYHRRMVEFHQDRIKRLKTYIKSAHGAGGEA